MYHEVAASVHSNTKQEYQLINIYNIIYKTTNKVNNKIYIGVHSTPDLNDGYLGSGKHLKLAINKYGSDSFTREILHIFETPEEAYRKESEIVNESFVNRKDTYNLKPGGFGGSEKGRTVSDKTRKLLSDAATGKKLPPRSDDHRNKIGDGNRGKTVSEAARKKIGAARKGRTHSEEAKRKMSEAAKKRQCKPLSDETKRKISESMKAVRAKKLNTSSS